MTPPFSGCSQVSRRYFTTSMKTMLLRFIFLLATAYAIDSASPQVSPPAPTATPALTATTAAVPTPFATPSVTHVQMTPQYVWDLSILATVGLVACWIAFWLAVSCSHESISGILLNPGFFKTVTVMGVIAGTVILSLADRIEGQLTAAILSGIVGYVLGSAAGKLTDAERTAAKRKKNQEEAEAKAKAEPETIKG